ncbi:MAG: hypothetical protein HZA53_07290 [Planctomycetes bacterium]|nr:hypothetical protein [Planctomycetota bacterium]
MLLDTLLFLAATTPTASPELHEARAAVFPPSAPFSEPALNLPYTYLGLSYATTIVDGYSDDPSGLELDASYALNDTWFVFGSRSFLQGEASGSDVDLGGWHVGIGLHSSVAEHVDLVLGAGWTDVHADSAAPGPSNDEGYELRAGIRIALGARAEASAGASYSDLHDAGSDTALYLNGAYYLDPRFGLTAGFTSSNDVDTLVFGLRFVPR